MPNKGLKRIIREKIKFLDAIPDEFINQTVKGGQSPLFDIMVSEFLDKLEKDENGNILASTSNFRLINGIDKAWKDFQQKHGIEIVNKHLSNFAKIVSQNVDYYREILTVNKSFIQQAKNITTIINRRLGINSDGTLIPGGYMGDLLDDISVRNQVKEFALRNVANSSGFDATKKNLSDLINGSDGKLGALQKYYRNIAYDTYKQVDSLNNKLFGEEFNLKYFVYDGTLIKTSRKFCIKHCYNIYTVEQSKEWVNDPDLKVPNLETYEPLIDLGGVGCRHMIRFVTDEMAFALEPALKTVE